MTKAQTAAYIIAQSACAQAEILGMQAENEQHKVLGHSMAYDYDAFVAVIEKYGIHHNACITAFNEWATED